MAWRRPGDKPLSEPMMENLLTHICVTRPQWVKISTHGWSANAIWHQRSWSLLVQIIIGSYIGLELLLHWWYTHDTIIVRLLRQLAPSHYQNQCWLIVDWTNGNKFQLNFYQTTTILTQENSFDNALSKMAFCQGCSSRDHFAYKIWKWLVHHLAKLVITYWDLAVMILNHCWLSFIIHI